ncbi:MAG: class I SAM-dependent methyltransferase [Candidatus Bathyarchaeota archaeon]|nr:class I SAM-dependent methyltransferase [Candidatus Bathyarchaeota archaeon]
MTREFDVFHGHVIERGNFISNICEHEIWQAMTQFDEALRRYYDEQANVYDDMYMRSDLEWRRELEAVTDAMAKALSGRRLLEVACGTGFWTEIVAKVARDIVAIDISEKMLTIARKRKVRSANVEYRRGDAYALAEVSDEFNAGLANFWFSHVPKARIDEFLHGFHKKLGKTAVVFMADNVYVPGIGGQLVTKVGIEDTFKLRKASDGSEYEVLKNYYSSDTLRRLLSPKTSDLKVHEAKYFWWVQYMVP